MFIRFIIIHPYFPFPASENNIIKYAAMKRNINDKSVKIEAKSGQLLGTFFYITTENTEKITVLRFSPQNDTQSPIRFEYNCDHEAPISFSEL